MNAILQLVRFTKAMLRLYKHRQAADEDPINIRGQTIGAVSMPMKRNKY